ncbi:MAG: hypothetical protein ABL860_00245 [Candidatus Nitrotoga sp.]
MMIKSCLIAATLLMTSTSVIAANQDSVWGEVRDRAVGQIATDGEITLGSATGAATGTQPANMGTIGGAVAQINANEQPAAGQHSDDEHRGRGRHGDDSHRGHGKHGEDKHSHNRKKKEKHKGHDHDERKNRSKHDDDHHDNRGRGKHEESHDHDNHD